MKFRQVISILLIMLLLVPAGGCSLILSRDYLVITPHLENRDDEESGDELRAESYEDLKNSILYLIREGIGEGTIRLYNYSGDAESDSERAIKDTMNHEPLGAYAVEYMSYRCVRILSYYEVTVSITYQKTPEQIRAIKEAENISAFKELLNSAYTNYEDMLVVLVPWYYEDQYDVKGILESAYYNDPLNIVVPPSFSLKIYPDTGSGFQDTGLQRYDWQRLLEISFDYPNPEEDLRKMAETLHVIIDGRLPADGVPAGVEGILTLEEIVTRNVEPVPDPEMDTDGNPENVHKDMSYTAYGALIDGRATSEGYALAFKTFCQRTGMDCYVIRGRHDGYLHCWNLVLIDGNWYHIDTYRIDITGSYDSLLKTDLQMADLGYKWNNASYPASDDPEISLPPVHTEETAAVESQAGDLDLPAND